MDYAFKVTTQGREVLAACLATGAPLRITKVEIGSGTVPEGVDLAGVHTLYQYVTEGTIAERRHEGDRLYLAVQYDNAKYPEQPAFFLSEFMVYVEDPETGENTDFIYATLGDYRQPVPAYSPELPESIFSHPMVIVVSNEIKVEITASPGLVTHVDLSSALAAHNTDSAAHEGLLQKISKPNLLDNANFIPIYDDESNMILPIDQRGITGVFSTAGSYFIDRWVLISGSVEITDEGLKLNGTIEQRFEYAFGDNLTATALSTTGFVAAEYDDEGKRFQITANGETIIAAKLELGDQQTLAHQDEGGNWVLNDPPPNYALELAKCQRYFQVFANEEISSSVWLCVGFRSQSSGNRVYGTLPLSNSMRSGGHPAITVNNINLVEISTTESKGYSVTKLSCYSIFNLETNGISAIVLNATPPNTIDRGNYAIALRAGAIIWISREL